MERPLHPNISVDCVIFGFDFKELNVILVERNVFDPNTGIKQISDLTLTGNHVYFDEKLEDAAKRILLNLTGLTGIYLKQFFTSGDPDRLKSAKDQLWLQKIGKDPGERVVSVCYFSLLNCDEVTLKKGQNKVEWHPVKKAKNLAFDHEKILENALKALRTKLLYAPVGFEMLPEKFTLTQLQKLYEVVFDVEFDKRNFRKKVAKMNYLIPLDEKQQGVSHKPARYYIFNREIYEKTNSAMFNFSI